MKYPKKLQAGDTIGIICTSSAVSAARIGEMVEALEKLGYKVKTADNLDADLGGFMAGTGKVRGEWVNKMFADEEVDAIICARGGDGSSRIMEYLDYDVIRKNPKIFMGYSDVTNLHLALTKECGLVTFHGPMVSSNIVDDFDEETKNSFFEAVNAEGSYEFKNPKGVELGVLKEGKATGRLIGGNLSLLSASVGTPYALEGEGNIIFIEEVCEPLSKIEKWAHHLKNSGILKNCNGIILGQFTKVVNEDMAEYDVNACIADILSDVDVPIMYNVQSGHGKPMMTLPMGAMCTMDTASKTITFDVER